MGSCGSLTIKKRGGGGWGEEEEKKKKNKKEETIIVRISLLDSCEITPVERGQLQKHFGLTGDLMREDIMLYGLAWLCVCVCVYV